MALTILNNIAALAAENQLNITSNSLNSTLEQLSSGSRINSGADDPAGLAIANGLEANIAALTQSSSNATDGVGELQVADGALSQVTTLLDRAVTLATESATGTVSDSQRGAIDTEYQSIKAEINSIGSTTNFNGGQVFTNNTLNVFLSDGSTAGSSTIGVSTGLLSSTSLNLGGTPATATLGEATASSSANATNVLTGGTFVGSTQANTLLTASTQFNALTSATATLNGGAFTNSVQASDTILGSTTAAFVGSTNATSVLTTTGTITAGDTVNVGGTTYTFETAASVGSGALNQVVAANLTTGGFAALQAAVNGTGTNGYTGAAFTANSEVAASASGNATITFTSKNAGAGGNAQVSSTYVGAGDGTAAAGVTAVTGNTINVAGQTYQLVAALSTTATAGEVVVGTGAATGNNETTLTNLEAAINNGPAGTGSNSLYATGTTANTSVTAGGSPASGTLTLTAKVNGTGGNSLAATTNAGAGVGAAFPNAFTGGINGSTVTLGTQTYTFVTALSSNSGGTANEILGGTEANDLTYLAQAVNNVTTAGTIGTTYSTGTAINSFVTAGTPTASTLGFTSKVAGAGTGSGGSATGNNIAVSTSGVGNFATASLTGGTAASSVTVGTQTYTFATAAQLNSSAFNVLINTTGGTTAAQILGSLQNLADAVNGTGAGVNYSSGAANGLATAAAPVAGSGNTSTLALTAQVNGLGTLGAATGNFTVASTAYTANGFGGNSNGFGAGTSTTFANGSVGDSVNIGGQVYNYVAALSTNTGGTANEVLVGGSVQSDLTNLVAAVNGGAGAGTTYGTPTVTNASASAVAGTTTATFTARTAGTAGNNIVASTSGGIGNFLTPDFTGGSVQQSQGGPAVAGDTVTVGAKQYTFVTAINANTAANSVLVGAGTGAVSEAASLQNLVAAVNGATGAGVTYGIGTTANASASGAYVASPLSGPVPQVVFTALAGGLGGNSIISGSTGGDNTFTTTTFAGGGASTNDLLTSSDATAALTLINTAVATVASLRGNIGATVNRLQSASAVITNQTQNLTSAENDVTAADIPSTVASLSQYSILEQTGVSALAQANQQQQLVLKLLQ